MTTMVSVNRWRGLSFLGIFQDLRQPVDNPYRATKTVSYVPTNQGGETLRHRSLVRLRGSALTILAGRFCHGGTHQPERDIFDSRDGGQSRRRHRDGGASPSGPATQAAREGSGQ